ncbi:MAG TPA: sigma-70 family RNA polymerase sigma factor [Nannocystaceae bacterium]|nr:sigma-70 family RNA polymerase sigma factor [Nannocystaceae bacterium]
MEEDGEAELRASWERGELATTATLWLERYGAEILSLLRGLCGRNLDADEVFSQFCEELWRSLPGLRWECSARTWSYVVARGAWGRALRGALRHRNVAPLSDVPQVQQLVAQLRSSTAVFQQTAVKDRFRELRDELPADDRMLLVLRVDRALEWNEIARVLCEDETPDAATLAKISQRVRKQFQRVKDRIRALARERGLVDEE